MAKREIGQRVCAMLKADENTVWLIGFGTYQGDHVPPDDAGGFNLGIPNPKLVMDDGSIIWGCECWWGDEKRMRESIGDRNVVLVDMAELRKPPEGGDLSRFTLDEVSALAKDLGFKITEQSDGVRITGEAEEYRLDLIADVMRVALALKLHPSQLQSNKLSMEDMLGDYASPYVDIDITFLWEPSW